ncbi:hypothetical protein [Acinetobacter sp. WZC-1]|uniref:hypothetical protein n=1 Tax=Acinetobacter sp. WZC-1 TaxID=3459034 RepID=UPI00403D985F
MSMTYIIGKEKTLSDKILLSVNINSTADDYISNLISYLFEDKYPTIYEKIVEQTIFMRFDELNKNEFNFVLDQIDSLFDHCYDLPENIRDGLYWWGELIKPIVDRDERRCN